MLSVSLTSKGLEAPLSNETSGVLSPVTGHWMRPTDTNRLVQSEIKKKMPRSQLHPYLFTVLPYQELSLGCCTFVALSIFCVVLMDPLAYLTDCLLNILQTLLLLTTFHKAWLTSHLHRNHSRNC